MLIEKFYALSSFSLAGVDGSQVQIEPQVEIGPEVEIGP
jgi:hypothetical protein